MDKILSIKEKYHMINYEVTAENFSLSIRRMQNTMREWEEQILAAESTLHERREKVAKTEESVIVESQRLSGKLQELARHNECIAELEVDKKRLQLDVHRLQKTMDSKKCVKPNLKDQLIIDQGRKKFDYYKRLTGIRWDFSAPQEICKGYITNGEDYIHSFNYNVLDPTKVEKLWAEIGKVTGRLEHWK